jgi:hypothetical protein
MSTAMNVDGIVTASIAGSETPLAASAANIATVAAEIGDARTPWNPATTLMDSGRSGGMSALRATSAMIGSSA